MDIVDQLPGKNELASCDTTSFVYSIGKTTALKVLQDGKNVKVLWKLGSTIDEIHALGS